MRKTQKNSLVWKMILRCLLLLQVFFGAVLSLLAQSLEGIAILPADSFVAGPTSGQFIAPANGGIHCRRAGQ